MSDIGPTPGQLSRKIAALAVPGITEPKPTPNLLITSLDTVPVSRDPNEARHRLQRMRAEARRREAELPFAQIDAVGFNLFSTEEIDELAVVDITRPDKEGPHTVRDLHLGPHNESQSCETCAGSFRACSGHYGKVVIPKIIHPLAIAHVIQLLGCVCNSCGGLLLTKEDLDKEGITRMTGLRRLQATKELTSRLGLTSCNRYDNVPGVAPCQKGLPIYGSVKEMTDQKDYKLSYKFSKKQDVKYFRTPNDIYKILDSISPSDAELLGFIHGSHPRTLISERLLIIPYCARPDLYQDDTFYPDDISSIYSEIIKKANDYWDTRIPSAEKENIIKELYFKIKHLMRNEGGQYKQGTAKVYTDITSRFQGKTALIRSHLLGKRVNFAGRTVAGPGGYLRVDEIGIPEAMAVKLTRPIVVTDLNRAEMQSRYESRRVLYITPRTGRFAGNRIMVTEQFVRENPNYQVRVGDTLDRILEDGDVVLVNRQPTLHRQSIIALRAKIIPGRIVLINLSITSPLNADFDGDELNIHVPQTIEAYAEAEILYSTQAGLMNDQTNQPMMGIVYNGLTGAYLMSRDDDTVENRRLYSELTAQYEQMTDELEEYQASLVPPNEYERYITLEDTVSRLQHALDTIADIDTAEYINMTYELDRAKRDLNRKRNEIKQIVDTESDPQRINAHTQLYMRIIEIQKTIGMLDPIVFNQCLVYLADRPQFESLRQRCQEQGLIWGTGKSLLSAAFPIGFYYNTVDESETDPKKIAKQITIRNGILLRGTLSKDSIGRSDNNIIAEMYKHLGPTATVNFMSDVQIVTREYLQARGFTVGYDDCVSDDPTFQDELSKLIADAEVKVLALSGPSSNKIQADAQERQILKALDIVKSAGDKIAVEKLRKDNNMMIMVYAGSKGTSLNLAQISSLLGPQRVNGQRIPANMPGNRTLPIYRPGDQDPRARGFCRSSFYSGLGPDEMFFHAMGGREGITDTAVNTANVGQLGHNLINSAADNHVSHDGSVRTADGSIIEFVYGGDGFNAGELGTVKIRNEAIPFFRNLKQLAYTISAKYE